MPAEPSRLGSSGKKNPYNVRVQESRSEGLEPPTSTFVVWHSNPAELRAHIISKPYAFSFHRPSPSTLCPARYELGLTLRNYCVNQLVMRRKRTHRIGHTGAPCRKKSLRAAPPPINFAAWARTAGFAHPSHTAICIECL